MFEGKNEEQARKEVLDAVRVYCDKYHNIKKPFAEGQRIPYASRVYDSEEMVRLADEHRNFG